MIEIGVVVDKQGQALYWNAPDGRTSTYIPDSSILWEVMWEAFKEGSLGGYAHSHPGSGVPVPSVTDLTTFDAIERGLGTTLDWWITSKDHVVLLRQSSGVYQSTLLEEYRPPEWLAPLRKLSRYDR